MKKTSRLLGAIALSAALTMGTAVPAFADDGEYVADTDGADDDDVSMVTSSDNYHGDSLNTAGIIDSSGAISSEDNDTSTKVYLTAITSQIDATIPLKVGVVANLAGGNLTTPTAGAYKLTNNSSQSEVYVTEIETTLKNAFCSVTDSVATIESLWGPTSSTELSPSSYNGIVVGTGSKTRFTPTYGYLNLHLKGGSINGNSDESEGTIDTTTSCLDNDIVSDTVTKFVEVNGTYVAKSTLEAKGDDYASSSSSEYKVLVAGKKTDDAEENDYTISFKLSGGTSEISKLQVDQILQLVDIKFTVSAMNGDNKHWSLEWADENSN